MIASLPVLIIVLIVLSSAVVSSCASDAPLAANWRMIRDEGLRLMDEGAIRAATGDNGSTAQVIAAGACRDRGATAKAWCSAARLSGC